MGVKCTNPCDAPDGGAQQQTDKLLANRAGDCVLVDPQNIPSACDAPDGGAQLPTDKFLVNRNGDCALVDPLVLPDPEFGQISEVCHEIFYTIPGQAPILIGQKPPVENAQNLDVAITVAGGAGFGDLVSVEADIHPADTFVDGPIRSWQVVNNDPCRAMTIQINFWGAVEAATRSIDTIDWLRSRGRTFWRFDGGPWSTLAGDEEAQTGRNESLAATGQDYSWTNIKYATIAAGATGLIEMYGDVAWVADGHLVGTIPVVQPTFYASVGKNYGITSIYGRSL